MPATSEYLPTYLNDHLAGSVVGLALARRAVEHNRESDYARDLRVIAEEIAEDKRTLEELMRELTIRRNPVKRVGAWVGERVRRLKPNRGLRYSPLSRLEEIEMLTLGVTGKRFNARGRSRNGSHEHPARRLPPHSAAADCIRGKLCRRRRRAEHDP